jgi:hypothetical protein
VSRRLQRRAEECFYVGRRTGATDCSDEGLSLGGLEAEGREEGEDLLGDVDGFRVMGLTVWRAVRVSETEAGAGGALDLERAAVVGAMVRAAQWDEAFGIVGAALGARIEMMHVEEDVIGAARNDAAFVVAAQDVAANGRGDCLRGAGA